MNRSAVRHFVLLGALLVALLVAADGSSGAGDALTGDIYVVSSHGGVRRALTSRPARELQPSLSPDGRLIAYSSVADGIWLMNADGSEQRPLGITWGERPQWSPTGRSLVYTGGNVDYCPGWNCVLGEVWRVNADGTGNRRLFEAADHPVWSPNGRRLLFRDFVFGESGALLGPLEVAAPDGSSRRMLFRGTALAGMHSLATWSPDGKRVAFNAWRGEQSRLFVVNADGSHLRRLTTGTYPAWSPNGKLIAFERSVRIRGTWRDSIWVIPATGGRARRISADGRCPTWSPRGKRIAFLTNGKLDEVGWRRSSLVVVRADGHGRKVLANATDCYQQGWAEPAPPVWSADGRWIYFGG